MESVVPLEPAAPLGAAATSAPSPTADGKGRVTRVVPSETNCLSAIVVAGAPRCGKSALVNALLGPPALAPAAGSATVMIPRPATPVAEVASAHAGRPRGGGNPNGGTAGAVVTRPQTSAYLTFRHGDNPAAFAYVPGHRGPRPLTLDELGDGDLAAVVRGGPGRPARRVEVSHPAGLLRQVNLVDTPGAAGFDQAYRDIVLDALDGGAALLFVTEASAALAPADLDFLAEVEQAGATVTFVLTKVDAYPQWPAVLSANQKLVHDHAPRLATSRWYAVSTQTGRDAAAPAALEEAALGLAGLGIAALRRALTEPVPAEPAIPRAPAVPAAPGGLPTPGGPPTPAGQPGPAAPKVVAGATDVRWMEVLDAGIRSLGQAGAQRLSLELAAIHVRCVQETSADNGMARLAHAFDHELHALSVRTTRGIDEAATTIMRRVFAEILDGPPDNAALTRIRRATRRAVEAAESGPPEWDRVLLVTATSGIAVTTGRGAVASLSAVAPRPLDTYLLPPVGVALSAGCYSMWRGGGERAQCRAWLQRAIRVLEVDLGRERARRLDYLREALAVVAADTIDHGVLLA